ncbi:MAG TPA: hypothetical protein VM582_02010 [Candidatus Thermoplasmatota archaeon]|nr:hypothetical protein [Candidatus Thermoplasmatota archaeon]
MTRATLVALVALLAGCVTAPAGGPDTAQAAAPALFASDSCEEGGGYVVWNTDAPIDDPAGNLPEPFVYADATDDLDSPPVTAYGEPSRRPLEGAYHAVISCPTWTFRGVEKSDLRIAFVALRIQAPPFDPAPLDREYLLPFIAVNDPQLEAALVALGIAPEKLISSSLSFENGVLISTMQMDHHGDIVSVVPIETRGARERETMRFWILAPVKGGATAIALDVEDVGGTRLLAPTVGHFDHRAPSAAPPLPGTPLHEFNSWALAYRDVARTVRIGPAVDAFIDHDMSH